MDADYNAKMQALAQQRKEARCRAAAVERAIKKEKQAQKRFLKNVKGISSARLYAAAERARAAEAGAAASSG